MTLNPANKVHTHFISCNLSSNYPMKGFKGYLARSDPPEEPLVQPRAIGRSEPRKEPPMQSAATGRSDPPEEPPVQNAATGRSDPPKEPPE